MSRMIAVIVISGLILLSACGRSEPPPPLEKEEERFSINSINDPFSHEPLEPESESESSFTEEESRIAEDFSPSEAPTLQELHRMQYSGDMTLWPHTLEMGVIDENGQFLDDQDKVVVGVDLPVDWPLSYTVFSYILKNGDELKCGEIIPPIRIADIQNPFGELEAFMQLPGEAMDIAGSDAMYFAQDMEFDKGSEDRQSDYYIRYYYKLQGEYLLGVSFFAYDKDTIPYDRFEEIAATLRLV